MTLVTLSEIKVYLWVTWTDQDTYLTQLQNIAESKINREIWDVSYQQRTEQVTLCRFRSMGTGVIFRADNLNVDVLTEIDWVSYAGTKGTDYRVIDGYNGRKIRIEDLEDYVASIIDPYFDFKYNSWRATIPRDIKELVFKLVEDVFEAQDGKTVKSFKSWPDSVTFADITMEKSLSKFDTILAWYKIIDV